MDAAGFGGRVVVVTGAAGRLGRLVAGALEEEGAQVAALVRTGAEARLVPVGPGSQVRSYPCDVTDESSVRGGFRQIAEQWGRVDALVHTVGAWAATPLLDTSAEAWEHLVRVNLLSTFLCFREAARLMGAGEGGSLVAVASMQGADRGAAGQSAYSAAKAGVIRIVESAARELAGQGITARAVAPSTILFDEDGTPGVRAGTVVRLCLDCARPGSLLPSGAVIRAYGTATES